MGDTIHTLGQSGNRASLRIVGEVKDSADLLGSLVVTQEAMARDFAVTQDTFDFVKLEPGVDPATVQDRIDALLTQRFPTAEVLNQEELKQNQENQINPLLGLVYALLSLAIIVSLFGIANTLALSIYERTRELGMLRAVGMSRRQVRRLIRYESVITALIGAVLGMVLGPDLRRADVGAAPGRGLRAQLPGRPARLHPGRRRVRRGGRGDRPGAAGGAARRPPGAGVRVATVLGFG